MRAIVSTRPSPRTGRRSARRRGCAQRAPRRTPPAVTSSRTTERGRAAHLLGNAGLRAERQPAWSATAPTRRRGPGCPRCPTASIRLLRIRPEQERPAELHLGAEHEEEPEAPPLGEVLGRDGEMHECGACRRDGGDRERQRQSPPQPDEPDQHGRRNRCPGTPGLECEQRGRQCDDRKRRLRATEEGSCVHEQRSPTGYRSVREALRHGANAKMPGMRRRSERASR